MESSKNRYAQIIEKIFLAHHRKGVTAFDFDRSELTIAAQELSIKMPKNPGDVIYSFRYRSDMPETIARAAPEGHVWIIRSTGKGRYRFVFAREANFAPNPMLAKTKIPNSTPGIVEKYALGDEQALLAKIRYNRLIDVFTGVVCYSLQSHLRTTLDEIGQVETDEVYVGVDRHGVHYVFPIQAKGGKDRIGTVQIEQDFAFCKEKYPAAIGRPIAAQLLADGTIALFEFVQTEEGLRVESEKQYVLVQPEQLSDEELEDYRKRAS